MGMGIEGKTTLFPSSIARMTPDFLKNHPKSSPRTLIGPEDRNVRQQATLQLVGALTFHVVSFASLSIQPVQLAVRTSCQ